MRDGTYTKILQNPFRRADALQPRQRFFNPRDHPFLIPLDCCSAPILFLMLRSAAEEGGRSAADLLWWWCSPFGTPLTNSNRHVTEVTRMYPSDVGNCYVSERTQKGAPLVGSERNNKKLGLRPKTRRARLRFLVIGLQGSSPTDSVVSANLPVPQSRVTSFPRVEKISYSE